MMGAEIEAAHGCLDALAVPQTRFIGDVEHRLTLAARIQDLFERQQRPSLLGGIGSPERRDRVMPTVRDVIDVTAARFRVSPSQIFKPGRERIWVLPRHIAMYLCRKHLGTSYPNLGKEFGRDHSTVQYACRAIGAEMKEPGHTRRIVEEIERELGIE